MSQRIFYLSVVDSADKKKCIKVESLSYPSATDTHPSGAQPTLSKDINTPNQQKNQYRDQTQPQPQTQ